MVYTAWNSCCGIIMLCYCSIYFRLGTCIPASVHRGMHMSDESMVLISVYTCWMLMYILKRMTRVSFLLGTLWYDLKLSRVVYYIHNNEYLVMFMLSSVACECSIIKCMIVPCDWAISRGGIYLVITSALVASTNSLTKVNWQVNARINTIVM
jgi:hypothetical protein